MPLNGKNEFIFQDSKGKTFNFFLDEKEEIQCISSNTKHQWVSKDDVFPKRCSSLDIVLDGSDRFHIVSYHYDGDFYYHYRKNNEWKSIQLTSLSKSERIFYPKACILGSNIHVFYDLQQSTQRDRCTLFHYTYDEKAMTWVKNNICTLRFNRFVTPYKVLTYKKRILLLYISIINNNDEICLIEYYPHNDQWSKPQQLTNTTDQKLYMDALMDQEGNLHITWCQYKEQDGLMVQYLKTDLKNVDLKDQKISSLSKRLNCSFPQLILMNQQLYCMWVEYGHLAVSKSNDMGSNWMPPSIVDDSKINNFKRYRYGSNQSKSQFNIQCEFLYGTHYPSIQFLGFGGDNYDEISASES
ncbi:hypothetical protein [Alkaliphilus hydrothermalis]|uniref:Uncharacterized protein n=1 Tax=Alkaliphilus hydrothermalis TaxID=1482730 RepID=A0ABS2NLV5_9FIRM|nr:hypothetical protein [Alkaliphilus hydrothermalis]MBM7613921.1 hypothetical protein [Alkaliphilus hydrothermalis]